MVATPTGQTITLNIPGITPGQSFQILRSDTPSDPGKLITTTSDNQFIDHDVVPNKKYYYSLIDVSYVGKEHKVAIADAIVVVQPLSPYTPWWLIIGDLLIGLISQVPPLLTLISSSLVTGDSSLRSFWLLLFKRYRKSHRWGYVQSLSEVPIVGVHLGLLPEGLGVEVPKTVSDLSGGFDFATPTTGIYQLAASASGYLSSTGNPETFSAEAPDPSLLITLTNVGSQESRPQIAQASRIDALRGVLEKASLVLFLGGLILSVYDVITFPSIVTWLVCGIYGIFTILELKQLLQAHLKGEVLAEDGQPVANTLIRAFITEMGIQHLVATSTSNGRGLFSINLPAGEYTLSSERSGYSDSAVRGLQLPRAKITPVGVVLEEITYSVKA